MPILEALAEHGDATGHERQDRDPPGKGVEGRSRLAPPLPGELNHVALLCDDLGELRSLGKQLVEGPFAQLRYPEGDGRREGDGEMGLVPVVGARGAHPRGTSETANRVPLPGLVRLSEWRSAQPSEHMPQLRVQEQQVGAALVAQVEIQRLLRDQRGRCALGQRRPDVDVTAERIEADDAHVEHGSLVEEDWSASRDQHPGLPVERHHRQGAMLVGERAGGLAALFLAALTSAGTNERHNFLTSVEDGAHPISAHCAEVSKNQKIDAPHSA